MLPYVLLLIILIVLSLVEKTEISFAVKSMKFDGHFFCCAISLFVLNLFMGLRSPSVGCDLPRYIYRYMNAESMLEHPFEKAYNYLNYFFSELIHAQFQSFLFFTTFITCLALFFIFLRYSRDTSFSVILYITIGMFSMALSGIRQTLAMSIVWLSVYFVEKRRFILFSLFVLLASSFHNSAIVFLITFFLWGYCLSRKQCLVIFLMTLSTFFFRNSFNSFVRLLQPIKYDYIDLSVGYDINVLVLFVPILITFFCFWFQEYDCNEKCDCQDSFFFIFSCLNIFFLILSLSNNQVGRLSFYFNIGNCLLIPSVIKKQEKYGLLFAKITKVAVIVFSLVYFFISTPGGTLKIDNYSLFF